MASVDETYRALGVVHSDVDCPVCEVCNES